jgi:HAD superfamily hydrolase (TIGR01509 family)
MMEPPEGTTAMLFDCDGTLVDTLGLYRICWRQVFGRHGFEMTDEWFDTWAGHSMEPFVRAAFPDSDDAVHALVAQEGVDLFLESTHLLEPLEHVVDVARAYHGRLPMAVVSGGPRPAVVESLDAVGITGLFDFIVTADDVALGKPAPDGYLLAIERLGVRAEDCIAYEDTGSGIASAQAAGVRVIVDVRREGH